MYIDRAGRPLTLRQWCALMEENDGIYRRVGLDGNDEVEVSTVWMGIGMWWSGHYETMIFTADPNHRYDQKAWRWSSEEQAVEGHALACMLMGLVPHRLELTA
jgi:hypothetical protein